MYVVTNPRFRQFTFRIFCQIISRIKDGSQTKCFKGDEVVRSESLGRVQRFDVSHPRTAPGEVADESRIEIVREDRV